LHPGYKIRYLFWFGPTSYRFIQYFGLPKHSIMRIPASALFLGLLSSSAVFSQGTAPLIDQKAEALLPKVIEWRRHIHENPELGNREFKTMEYIAAHCRKLGLEVQTNISSGR
jgi:hypothetical protein